MACGRGGGESAEAVEEPLALGRVGGPSREQRVEQVGDQVGLPVGEATLVGLTQERGELGAGDRDEAGFEREAGQGRARSEAVAGRGGGVGVLLDESECAGEVAGGEASPGRREDGLESGRAM